MSSFSSVLSDLEAMNRLNPGRKRPAPPGRVNDFEVARKSQKNEMFFTDDDDADSLFGGDEIPAAERTESRPRQIQTRIQTQNQPVRGSQSQPRQNTQGNTSVAYRKDLIPRTNRSLGTSIRPVIPTSNAPPAPIVNNIPETFQIKDEETEMDTATESDYLSTIPTSQHVKIFVGRRNRSIKVNRADLSKSPTLLSYIVDDPIQGSFIMRPQLMTTHYEDFAAVSQFLRAGEYAPLLLENPTDQAGPKILNGLKSDEDYAKELVKSGKLYGLAKTYSVEGMAELVFKKVSEVDAGKFSIESLVRVAEVVFKNGTNIGGSGNLEGGGTAGQDLLEEWIVGKLAFNFQEIMRTQREKFFEVVRVTGKKMLLARVLEEVAMKYRVSGGKLPEPVIELD